MRERSLFEVGVGLLYAHVSAVGLVRDHRAHRVFAGGDEERVMPVGVEPDLGQLSAYLRFVDLGARWLRRSGWAGWR